MCNLHLRFSRHKFVFSDTQNKAAKSKNKMENWAGDKNGERCWVHGGGKAQGEFVQEGRISGEERQHGGGYYVICSTELKIYMCDEYIR